MEETQSSLSQWRMARRVVLTSITLAGLMATSLAWVARPMGATMEQLRSARALTYSGIGVVIERLDDNRVMIRHVIEDAPADGLLRPGMEIVKVNGQTPTSLPQWASTIRGEAGTTVELTVAHHCGGERTVALTRDLIRIRY